jgi:hypothetical protein
MRRTIAIGPRAPRVRYPAHWLEPRYSAIESELRTLPGVRAVQGRPLTGSLRIDYDPYSLAADAIVDKLDRMTAELAAPSTSIPAHPPRGPRQTLPSAPVLKVLGATSMLVTACCLPVPQAITAGLLLASAAPAFFRAGATLATRRRLNGDVLEASTLALLIARRNLTSAALLTWVRAVGELVVARSIVRARTSLSDVVGVPERIVTRRTGDHRESVDVGASPGDVVVVTTGQRSPSTARSQRRGDGESTVDDRRGAAGRVSSAIASSPPRRRHGEIEIRAEQLGPNTAVGGSCAPSRPPPPKSRTSSSSPSGWPIASLAHPALAALGGRSRGASTPRWRSSSPTTAGGARGYPDRPPDLAPASGGRRHSRQGSPNPRASRRVDDRVRQDRHLTSARCT